MNERPIARFRAAEGVFGAAPIGDVPRNRVHRHDFAVFDDELCVLTEPELGSVLRDRRELEVRRRRAIRELLLIERPRRGAEVGPDQRQEIAADQLVMLVLHDPCGGRIHERAPSVRVAAVDDVARVLDEVPVASLAPGERGLDAHAARHVAVVDDDAAHGAVVEPVDGDRLDVAPGAVVVPHAERQHGRLARVGQRLGEPPSHRRRIIRVNQLEDAPRQRLRDRVAEHPLVGLTRVQNPPVRREQQDDVRAVLDERVQQFSAGRAGRSRRGCWGQ
jgi:hypothetical protein